MNSIISFWSHTWLPVVITSTPQLKKLLHISLVKPTPWDAAFSPLTITKSIFFYLISFKRLFINFEQPAIPTTSPKNSILILKFLFL